MPQFQNQIPKYKRRKTIDREWKNFQKGLNLLLRETELGTDEYSKGDNILLKGSGVPTGRWGTQKYFSVNNTGTIRGFVFYNEREADGGYAREILALTDEGYLAKRNGTGSTQVTGASWTSGSIIRSEQLGGKTYIVSRDKAFVEYDGTDLSVFVTIPKPTNLLATNYSGTTGPNRISYKIATLGPNGGSTESSDNYVLENVPFDLTTTQINVSWDTVSAPTISGYEIYRGTEGDEAYIDAVGPEVTNYTDIGAAGSQIVQAPFTNTTGGIQSPIIVKYKDRFLMIDKNDPTKLMVSGRYPYHTSFNIAYGGGYVYIDPDGGESIKAIQVQPIADKIVIYKDHSSYLVSLDLTQVGNSFLLDPSYQAISTSIGCSNQDTAVPVENDVFYFGKDGIYVTGYEPNFLNIIRTNEVSARVRPYLDTISDSDYEAACAEYFENRYILSFPGKREMLVYDRERGSFAGIWKLPFGISHMKKYYDDSGTEKWVLGSAESNQVYTFEKSVNSDDGTVIYKSFKTNKEDFGDWTLLTILKFFYILFGNITGTTTVNIIVENRLGNTSNAKTFTISGAEVTGISGYGVGTYGTYPYGVTANAFATTTDEITRWGTLFKQARLVQIEVNSTANNSNFDLLSIKLTANKQAEGSLSSSQRV